MKEKVKTRVEDRYLTELARGSWGQLTLRTVPPGAEVGGHSHPNCDERWWLLQGEAEVVLGDNGRVVRRFGVDSILWVRAGTWHRIRNVGQEDVVFVFWSELPHEEQEP